jgi:mRNA-degrading endonuclease RelE of RelBE toxin-antitoxin system
MYLDVVWTNRAVEQFQSLSPTEQQNAQRLIETLRANPDVGQYDYTRPLPNNGQQTVYTVYGLLVKVRYTYRGIFRRRLALQIEEVQPTDLLSQDAYDEKTRP